MIEITRVGARLRKNWGLEDGRIYLVKNQWDEEVLRMQIGDVIYGPNVNSSDDKWVAQCQNNSVVAKNYTILGVVTGVTVKDI